MPDGSPVHSRDGCVPSDEVARLERSGGTQGSRLVGIEGMRAIAASSILVYHVWLYGAPGGGSVDMGILTKGFDQLRAGVTLFFVLSGFLLFRPYVAAACRSTPTPALGKYLRNRVLRIVPAYWFILLFVAVVLERGLLRHPEQLLANATFAQGYFKRYLLGLGIVPAWSLCIEVIFYLCVPVLGGAAISLARRRKMGVVRSCFAPVAAMLVIGILSKVLIHVASVGVQWQYSFPAHADWFAGGMALAVLRVRWEDGLLTLPRFWRIGALVTALLLTTLSVHLYYIGTLSFLEYQTPIGIACALVLALVVFATPDSRLLRVLGSRPFVAAGLASYSLFLWHDPILRALRSAGYTAAGPAGLLLNVGVLALLAGAGSALSYRFVERPALARKLPWQREQSRPLDATPGPTRPALAETDIVAAPVSSA